MAYIGNCGTPDQINDRQLDVMKKIQSYGSSKGYPQDIIDYALRAAYIESKLGESLISPTGKFVGLYQYDAVTWNERHKQISSPENRNNLDFQIQAFYKDIDKFLSRWNDPAQTGIPRSHMTRDEYLYSKHHDGANYTGWFNENQYYAPPEGSGVPIFNSECFEPTRTPAINPSNPSAISVVEIPYSAPEDLGFMGSGYNCRPYTKVAYHFVMINGYQASVPYYWHGTLCTEDGDGA